MKRWQNLFKDGIIYIFLINIKIVYQAVYLVTMEKIASCPADILVTVNSASYDAHATKNSAILLMDV